MNPMKNNQKTKLTFDDSATAEYQPLGCWSGQKVGATRDQSAPGNFRATTSSHFLREGNVRMNKARGPVTGIKIGFGMALLAVLMGCVGVGYVDGGYVPPVVVSGPDVYFFGGIHERGRDVRDYSHRGFESRAVAHPGRGEHGEKR
jgi:hypothetical protein